jgi:2-isopropylmalate synthase
LKTRNDLYPVTTSIDPSYIVPISKLVSSITGFPVQPNKAIVGANAFAHESGIHQDGVLKMRETYEIMKAEDVGWTKNKLSLGKLSGRAAFAARIAELDITLDDKNEFERAFKQFKNLADKKREIFDQDLQTLISDVQFGSDEIRYSLIDLEIKTKLGHSPEAKIIVGYEGQVYASEATGDGAVDAIFNAIEKLVNSGTSLKVYSVNAVTQGTDSLGEVSVRLQKDERIVNGQGADTDILIASAKAYLNALTLMRTPDRVHPQFGGI